VIGRTPAKLALLARFGDAVHCIINTSATLATLQARAANVVVEITGSPHGFAQALTLVRPGGVLVLKSTFAENIANFDLSRLVVDEITLIGSRCGPFAPAIRLLASGLVQVEPLIQARYPLTAAAEALTHARQKGVLKTLIQP